MRVAALAGPSNSGKTTIIEELIRRYVAQGLTVAAIKHTHHELNSENRGDTARFEKAGAKPVILANDEEAICFSPSPRAAGRRWPEGPDEGLIQHSNMTPSPGASRHPLPHAGEGVFRFSSPLDLLNELHTDIVLIEGFKSFNGWPRIDVARGMTADDVAIILDRIWRS